MALANMAGLFLYKLRKEVLLSTKLYYLEAEFGTKFEYVFCRNGCSNRLYVKPSVIQTFVNGGKTRITGIGRKIKSMQNETLGRVEVGGEFELSHKWSGYANTGYTFGEDYDAYDFALGAEYKF